MLLHLRMLLIDCNDWVCRQRTQVGTHEGGRPTSRPRPDRNNPRPAELGDEVKHPLDLSQPTNQLFLHSSQAVSYHRELLSAMGASGLTLVPVDVDNPMHMAELRRQRVVSEEAG